MMVKERLTENYARSLHHRLGLFPARESSSTHRDSIPASSRLLPVCSYPDYLVAGGHSHDCHVRTLLQYDLPSRWTNTADRLRSSGDFEQECRDGRTRCVRRPLVPRHQRELLLPATHCMTGGPIRKACAAPERLPPDKLKCPSDGYAPVVDVW